MSLAREALRISTVRALRASPALAQWIGDRVRDSEAGPIEDAARESTRPEIVVYTDDATFGAGDGEAVARSMFTGGTVNLVLEIVMTTRTKLTVEVDGEDGWRWECPPLDAAMELTIGMIERLVKVALSHDASPWADIWRSFALEVGEVKSQRGTLMREGVRFAGRQLVLAVKVPGDPIPGSAAGPRWATFLAAMAAEPDLAPVAPMFAAMVAGGPIAADDAVTQRAYAMTGDEMAAMGLRQRVDPPVSP